MGLRLTNDNLDNIEIRYRPCLGSAVLRPVYSDATLKSIDYNVAMTFILNNNNNHNNSTQLD